VGVVLDLRTDEIENIHVGGLLHEIGKVDGSIDTLRKAAAFDNGVPRKAAFSVSGPAGGLLRNVIGLVETIGERYDGAGPQGLAGDRIPLGARVLASAEEYESRIAEKPYGAGLAPADALVEVEALSGSRLDPDIVRALITTLEFD
jgi:HD-GYP domain-containing protein (c-di-GMP phosphodiesterase class II)